MNRCSFCVVAKQHTTIPKLYYYKYLIAAALARRFPGKGFKADG